VPGRWRTRHVFFLGIVQVGGAERVHADILDYLADVTPLVVLTDTSTDCAGQRFYRPHAPLLSVARFERRTFTRSILIGFLAARIDALAKERAEVVVFGAKSELFCALLPYLAASPVISVDLTHAFGGYVATERLSLPVAQQLDRRVVIAERTKHDFEALYRANGIPLAYVKRIEVVPNRVLVPVEPPPKASSGPLEVLYVGRGAPEKRLHLLLAVAEHARTIDLPCRFEIIGDVVQTVPAALGETYRLRGWIDEPARVREFYRRAHVLLLASEREGFPLVIMEAMAHGVVPITTDVGGIAEHVTNGRTGFLIEPIDEAAVVESMTARLAALAADRQRLDQMALAAHGYARRHFVGEHFGPAYREILRA
jgi:glycosyltransferase involved in cell wall biosynthesis